MGFSLLNLIISDLELIISDLELCTTVVVRSAVTGSDSSQLL